MQKNNFLIYDTWQYIVILKVNHFVCKQLTCKKISAYFFVFTFQQNVKENMNYIFIFVGKLFLMMG